MIGSSIIPTPLARLPWRLILLVMLICTIGLVNLYSAAGGSSEPWAMRQGVVIAFFFLVAIAISYIPENFIKHMVFPGYIVILLMLVAVEAVGFVGKGAQRWIDLGVMRLQPSEFMKPAIVLALARFYDLLPIGDIGKWRAIWPAGLMIGIPAALTLIQPDLGTALSIIFGGLVVMFLAGLPLWLFVAGGVSVLAAIPLAIPFLNEYQQRRVEIFLDPSSDPLGGGYNLAQSKIAIGSGGWWGNGFLNGSQSHLEYLPEGHTDFVFSAFVEEWGLFGGTLLITAFWLMIFWGMWVARKAKTQFSRLAAAGLTMVIFFYVTINLMMVMGLAPVVGIPLPLVSFGGNAVMTVMLCLGLLMGIERQSRTKREMR